MYGVANFGWHEKDAIITGISRVKAGESSHIKNTKQEIQGFDCKFMKTMSDFEFNGNNFAMKETIFVAAKSENFCKMTSEYHVEEGCELKKEDIKKGKERSKELHKAVEELPVANPNVCA